MFPLFGEDFSLKALPITTFLMDSVTFSSRCQGGPFLDIMPLLEERLGLRRARPSPPGGEAGAPGTCPLKSAEKGECSKHTPDTLEKARHGHKHERQLMDFFPQVGKLQGLTHLN